MDEVNVAHVTLHFYQRTQQLSETTDDFVHDVGKLADLVRIQAVEGIVASRQNYGRHKRRSDNSLHLSNEMYDQLVSDSSLSLC